MAGGEHANCMRISLHSFTVTVALRHNSCEVSYRAVLHDIVLERRENFSDKQSLMKSDSQTEIHDIFTILKICHHLLIQRVYDMQM